MDAKLSEELGKYGINYPEAMDRMDNDGDLYKRLALKYLDGSNYVDLVAAMDVAEYDDAYKYAHALKGVAGNLSFSKLFEVASAISNALYEGEYQAAAGMMDDLKKQQELVIDGLTAWSTDSL